MSEGDNDDASAKIDIAVKAVVIVLLVAMVVIACGFFFLPS